jgi:AraC-like DNA-binding protein
VRAGTSATLRDYLARFGLRLDQLALAAGLDPTQLGNPDVLIDQARWFVLVEAAARASRDPYLAVGYAEQMPWKDMGVVSYVALHSATAGDGLANLSRYFAIQQSGSRLDLSIGAREVRLSFVVDDPQAGESGQITEATFALVVRLLRDSIKDPAWAPKSVAFRHDAPADDGKHRRFFRAPISWRHRTDTMTLATGDLARRFVSADTGLLPHLLRHAEDCLARMPSDDEDDDVRRAVIAAISAGDPAIEPVAERVGQSPRSLQRALAAAGTSFKQLVDDTRLDLAKRYLADPSLSLTETAFLLGYSDLSAFSRAFKRWTDVSPLEFRNRARPSRAGPSAGSSHRSTRTR